MDASSVSLLARSKHLSDKIPSDSVEEFNATRPPDRQPIPIPFGQSRSRMKASSDSAGGVPPSPKGKFLETEHRPPPSGTRR